MRILIEEHQYRAEVVDNIIVGLTNLRNIMGKVSVNHVGYYYNPNLGGGQGDTVFILPKVLLEDVAGEELLFGKYHPEDIIDLGAQQLLSKEEYDFLYELAVWIYRAIVVFRDSHPDSDVVQQQLVQRMSTGRLQECNTYLDILLALQKFNRDNEDFFFFVLRNLHSGFNKINWTRTISHSQAVMQDDSPVYLNPVNKRRQVNFDEELLVIFFSILNYMHGHYGFPVHIPVNYELITGSRFETYLNGLGRIQLLKIKHKYFSDKALYLWELCYAFFDLSRRVKVEVNEQEYVLVKNFNIVFEAIIDELIGTDRAKMPPRLADQSDGKTVDHLWVDDILLPTNEKTAVYYIGDSKYYKHSTPVGENSIYKQFTYARNVIQWSFDALKGATRCDDEQYKIRLRDDRTEGYNVIPNFFISAKVDFETLDYGDDALRLHSDDPYSTSQYSDRLFDRDTMLLSHYDVNFLFVLALYARNNAGSKQLWRDEVRKRFRERVQNVLEKRYTFYALKGYDTADSERYITTHFQQLLGKLYRTEGERSIYTLAVESGGEGDGELIKDLRKHFYVAKCKLEEDPQTKIDEQIGMQGEVAVEPSQWLTLHYLERYTGKGILVGYYRDEEHLKWIMGANDRGSLIYNVRLKLKDEEQRPGAHTAGFYGKKDVQFVILYTDGAEQTGEYRVFHVKDTASKVTEERMRDTWYPSDVKGSYFFYRFDEEVTLGRLRIADLLRNLKVEHLDEYGSYEEGEPMFTTPEKLMEYREGY